MPARAVECLSLKAATDASQDAARVLSSGIVTSDVRKDCVLYVGLSLRSDVNAQNYRIGEALSQRVFGARPRCCNHALSQCNKGITTTLHDPNVTCLLSCSLFPVQKSSGRDTFEVACIHSYLGCSKPQSEQKHRFCNGQASWPTGS